MTVKGQPIIDLLGKDNRKEIEDKLVHQAYEIIDGKGVSCLGIGQALLNLLTIIVYDSQNQQLDNDQLPLVVKLNQQYGDYEIFTSVPAILNHKG